MMTVKNFDILIKKLGEKQKTWLITGVAGFIGSNLLEFLLKNNQRVIGIDNLSTGHLANIEEVKNLVADLQWKNFTFIEGDIRDLEICRQACKSCQYVLHQAAIGSVPRSILDPLNTNTNNIDGFLNMLIAARDENIERFVFAGSSSTYGDSLDLPKIENRIGQPLSPYAVTKLVNELYATIFADVYQLKIMGLRYFNVFGQRQDPHGQYAAVIPKWINSFIMNEQIFINGDGETSRDFCYIDNVVQANLLAATVDSKESINQIYNVAVGGNTTLNQLFNAIKKNLKNKGINRSLLEPAYREFRAGDIRHSRADISKAKRLLGYFPSHTFDQGIAKAVEWYLANSSRLI